MRCRINMPSSWVESSQFEHALSRSGDPHASNIFEVTITLPIGCKMMIDASIRLLSLANQLALTGRRVRIDFVEGTDGTMGYLDRVGFFDHLAGDVEVSPTRPRYSAAEIYRGNNTGVVEIARINRAERDRTLPTRLTNALLASCAARSDASELEGAAWTIFAELIDNIFSHSQTPLDG